LDKNDYEDPTLFAKCVSAITLKAEPFGYLSDCLSDPDIHVTVGLGRTKGPRRGPEPWLNIDQIGELSWASNIREGHLLSDHLEGSGGLFELERIENLTITVLGKDYHEDDVETFQKAIRNLQKLKRFRLVLEPAALAQRKGVFVWHSSGFNLEIEANDPHGRPKGRHPSA
jgi:hypothetical protein